MDFLGRTSLPLFAPVEKCRVLRDVLVEERNQCSVSREESRVSRGKITRHSFSRLSLSFKKMI